MTNDATTSPSTADACALLIGVDDYSQWDPARSLGCSVRDVVAWEAVARRLGIEQVRRLLSPVGRTLEVPRATGAAILAERDRLARWLSAAPGRKGMLVFAGHGDLDPDTATTWICPEDTKPGEPPVGRVAVRDLLAPFRDLDGSSLTVVLASCFSGGEACRAELADLGPNVVVVGAGGETGWEARLGGEWSGLLTWIATTVLGRWNVAEDGDDRWIDVSWGELVARCDELARTLRLPQRVTVDPPRLAGHAAFQKLGRPPAATTSRPALEARALQLSGGLDGFRVYRATVNGTVVAQVVVTSATPGGSLSPNTEYWDVKLNDIAGQDFRFTLVTDQDTSGTPPTGIGGTTWTSSLAATDPSKTSILPGGDYTWSQSSVALPYLRIRSDANETVWIRVNGNDLCTSWSVNDYADFVNSQSGLNYSNRYWSRDDWS